LVKLEKVQIAIYNFKNEIS